MNQARFAFSFLYIALGIAIMIRLLRFGLHRELFGGIVLALVLIAFGVYRLAFYVRARRMRVES